MMIRSLAAATCLVVAAGIAAHAVVAPKKVNIAHRGASSYAPEHTLTAYMLAMEQGADFVEQDLAVTKDGVLVCIHDVTLERTTNVEEVFPDRFVEVKEGPGAGKRWFVNDFTLAEIKRLDAGSWFDARFAGTRIPTFQEAIDLVRTKPGTGLYPELKDPEFYRSRKVDQDQLFIDIVKKNGLVGDAKTPLIIQSFDDVILKHMAKDLPAVPRVYLVGAENVSRIDAAEKVKEVAGWATGLGPNKMIVAKAPEVVKWARAAGLTVTPWTFRSSNTGTFPNVRAEMEEFLYKHDVDALFTDNPDQFPRR